MTTKFWTSGGTPTINPNSGTDTNNLLTLTQPTTFSASDSTATVTGPTAGLNVKKATRIWRFWTNPLMSVAISGTVTLNVWMAENNMSANVGAQVLLEQFSNDGLTNIATILNSEKGTELPVAAAPTTAQNWTASPTATTIGNGDRIRMTLLGNDGGGTMATGFTFNFNAGSDAGPTNADSWVQFTETVIELVPANPAINFQDPAVFMEKRNWLWLPRRPRLWRPELWLPPQPIPAIV